MRQRLNSESCGGRRLNSERDGLQRLNTERWAKVQLRTLCVGGGGSKAELGTLRMTKTQLRAFRVEQTLAPESYRGKGSAGQLQDFLHHTSIRDGAVGVGYVSRGCLAGGGEREAVALVGHTTPFHWKELAFSIQTGCRAAFHFLPERL